MSRWQVQIKHVAMMINVTADAMSKWVRNCAIGLYVFTHALSIVLDILLWDQRYVVILILIETLNSTSSSSSFFFWYIKDKNNIKLWTHCCHPSPHRSCCISSSKSLRIESGGSSRTIKWLIVLASSLARWSATIL